MKKTSTATKKKAAAAAAAPQIDPMTQVDITTRSLIVSLQISSWRGVKVDRKVTKEVAEERNADVETAGRYRKQVLPKSALEEIQKVIRNAREEHYRRTLPWFDDGQRICLASGWFEYRRALDKLSDEFNAAVEKLISSYEANYDAFLAEQKKRLGEMFEPKDYPAPALLRRKFAFNYIGMPTPKSEDFRVNFSREEREQLINHFDEARNAKIREGMFEVAGRVRKVAEHMVERLRKYKVSEDGKVEHTFRDSLVANVAELVALLPNLNLTGDPRLDQITVDMRGLTRYTADQLRDSEDARTRIADQAEAILSKMEAFI